MQDVVIGSRKVAKDAPAYLVAEVACCHEGDFSFMERLVLAMEGRGADGIKFQVFTAEGLVVASHQLAPLYRNIQFGRAEWVSLAQMVRQCGMDVLVDALEPWSLEMALAMRAACLKIHSSNLTNPFFVHEVAKTGLPVIVGCGGSTQQEIVACVDILRAKGVPVCLQHGYQGYPTHSGETNLRRMLAFARDFDAPLGFACHADGVGDGILLQNVLALGLGCSLLETHVSLDPTPPRTDYHSSLTPEGYSGMAEAVRYAEKAMGNGGYTLSPAEELYRKGFKCVVVAARPLRTGEILTLEDLAFKRADGDLLPQDAGSLLGQRLTVDLARDEALSLRHVGHVCAAGETIDASK